MYIPNGINTGGIKTNFLTAVNCSLTKLTSNYSNILQLYTNSITLDGNMVVSGNVEIKKNIVIGGNVDIDGNVDISGNLLLINYIDNIETNKVGYSMAIITSSAPPTGDVLNAGLLSVIDGYEFGFATTRGPVLNNQPKNFLGIYPDSLGDGNYNPIVKAHDHVLVDGYYDSSGNVSAEGGVVICPWSNVPSGMRMDSSGNFTFYNDVDVSGITTFLSSYPPVSLANPLPDPSDSSTNIPTTEWVQSAITNYLPLGSIIMWNGVTAPDNWALCDGTNGTPNLRDKFVLSQGTTYTLGSTGGLSTVTLSTAEIPAHSHSVTDPGHVHGYSQYTPGDEAESQQNETNVPYSDNPVTDQTMSALTGITINSTGGSGAHENMPPYYVLAFIMRIA